MIGRISGLLAEKNPPQVVVDVNGVGYEIDVPMSTFYHLPATGEKVTLHTQLIVREDAHLLYGFGTDAERATFRQLLKVSGVGPKVALAVLSGLSVNDLAAAVATQDTAMLVRVPGIGKKTAERLLLELKDKVVAALPASAAGSAVPKGNDVLNALLALGYNDREALSAIKNLPADLSVADGIRQALKLLART
ncbi:MAG: Holliday junction branch migration protein RuvA [Betaproteobacteria bacterium]|nr:Holliday junction branch migration protein RuvA [Betaproteobacteria bacterium]